MDDKERKVRSVYPILKMMLAVKKLDAYLTKASIRVMDGTCDAEAELFELPQQVRTMCAEFEAQSISVNAPMFGDHGDASRFHHAMYRVAHPGVDGATDYDVEKWVQKLRRARRKPTVSQ
jgi:hypothetical protein